MASGKGKQAAKPGKSECYTNKFGDNALLPPRVVVSVDDCEQYHYWSYRNHNNKTIDIVNIFNY